MVEAWDPAHPAALQRDYTGWRIGPWSGGLAPGTTVQDLMLVGRRG